MGHIQIYMLLIALGAFIPIGYSEIRKDGIQELRTEVMNEDYKVSWQADFGKKTADFWIEAKTVGFVGFGFSISGQMNGGDLVVGGVKNGEPYLKDYQGGDHLLIEDEQQDWEAENITEINGMTYMHIRRKFQTCDDKDIEITEGTVKLMWSMGATDDVGYHGNTNRGALAVNLLDPPPAIVDLSSFSTFNISKKIPMTSDTDTLYWCSMYKREASNVSQVVAFKPKLDSPEALKYTHHFNAYRCYVDEGEDADEIFGPLSTPDHPGQNCFHPGSIRDVWLKCQSMIYAWSFGGRILVLPDDIGFTWGESRNEYFFLEVHLDNVKLENHVVETGVTFYYTEKLRPIEAGILTIPHATTATLLIPPATENWEIVGHCTADCINKGVDTQGINIFNVNLHAHTSGRKMKFRIFRNGTELPWIANDDTYDFNFQENRPLPTPFTIYPGDHMSLECTFASTWKPWGSVIGGSSSYDEMCMVFALYYPRIDLATCGSRVPRSFLKNFEIEETTEIEGSADLLIVKPEKWANRTLTSILDTEVDWTTERKTQIQKGLKYGLHESFCHLVTKKKNVMFNNKKSHEEFIIPEVTYPEYDEEYQKPKPEC